MAWEKAHRPLVPGDEIPSGPDRVPPTFREDVVTQNQLTVVTVVRDGQANRVRAVMSAIDSFSKRRQIVAQTIGKYELLGSLAPAIRDAEGALVFTETVRAANGTYPNLTWPSVTKTNILLNDITQVVAENKVNIVAAQVGVTPDHTAVVTATIQVHSVSQLARVMSRIETLKDVISVQRDLG